MRHGLKKIATYNIVNHTKIKTGGVCLGHILVHAEYTSNSINYQSLVIAIYPDFSLLSLVLNRDKVCHDFSVFFTVKLNIKRLDLMFPRGEN